MFETIEYVSIYHFLEKEAKDLPPFIKQGEVS
jgi:hypothetical protein